MSKDYEKIKALWDKGLWSESAMRKAVEKGKITAQEFEEITGIKYN